MLRAVGVLVCLLFLPLAGASGARDEALTTRAAPGGGVELVLRWPGPVHVVEGGTPGVFVLRADRPWAGPPPRPDGRLAGLVEAIRQPEPREFVLVLADGVRATLSRPDGRTAAVALRHGPLSAGVAAGAGAANGTAEADGASLTTPSVAAGRRGPLARLAFDLPDRPAYRVERAGDSLRLFVESGRVPEIAAAAAQLPEHVATAERRRVAGGTEILLGLRPQLDALHTRLADGRILIDLVPRGGTDRPAGTASRPGSVAESPVAAVGRGPGGGRSPASPPGPGADVLAAKDAVDGDAAPDTTAGPIANTPTEVAAAGTTEQGDPPLPTAGRQAVRVPNVVAGERAADRPDASRTAAQTEPSAPALGVASTAAESARLRAAHADASSALRAGPVGPSLAAAAHSAGAAARAEPRGPSAEEPSLVAGAGLQAGSPADPAAVPSTGAPAVAGVAAFFAGPATADAGRFPAAVAQLPAAAAARVPAPRAFAVAGPDGAMSLAYAWPAPTAAAVFVRAGALWIVFDRPNGPAAPNVPPGGPLAAGTTVAHADATVHRFPLRLPLAVGVAQVGATWWVTLEPRTSAADPLVIASDPDAGELGFWGAASAIALDDPAVGDRLLVLTAAASGRGVPSARRMVDLDLLASAQGAVLAARTDRLVARVTADGVRVTRPGGLMLGRPPAPRTATPTAEPDAPRPG